VNTDSASGSVISGIGGSISVTQNLNTDIANGAVLITGTATVNNSNTINIISGNLVAGTITRTQNLNTSTISASILDSGTTAVTQIINTANASGTISSTGISGSAVLTNINSISISGAVAINAVVNLLNSNTVSINGNVITGGSVVGSLAVTQNKNVVYAEQALTTSMLRDLYEWMLYMQINPPATSAEIATAVRAELVLELSRIDTTISSRLAANGVPNVNVKYVNDVAIKGNGNAGNEWGPV
jgi:hypothetical protein